MIIPLEIIISYVVSLNKYKIAENITLGKLYKPRERDNWLTNMNDITKCY